MPLATILIEDNKAIRDALIPTLLELGDMEVIATAETAAEATAALEAFKDTWQLCVVDLFLKQGSGLAVIRAGKARLPHQRVVVLSNYATAPMRERCLQLGADGVFDKSTELDEFFERCRELFAG